MAKNSSKHKKKSNNKSYKKIAFIIAFIFIIIIGIKINKKEEKSNKMQVIINNENITEDLQDEIKQENDQIYMSFEDIQKFIDSTIYKENETDLIITTSPKKVVTLKKDDENVKINGATQKIKDAVIEENGKDYIAISELENVYDYEFKYTEASNTITIDSLNKKLIKAYVTKNVKIKETNKANSKTVDKVKKGNWLIYISEENKMAKVRTQNGKIGYVKKKYLDNFITEREDIKEENSENTEVEKQLEYDITKENISTFEKRENVINRILQEAIKNDKIYLKILYNETDESNYDRFKIEIVPVLKECGIKVIF